MRFLIIPGNNSLSHGVKSLAVQNRLLSNGHECLLAINPEREKFFKKYTTGYTLLSDIQENDGSSYPTINWFRDTQKIIDCINEEIELMQEYKPDRVLGVFRFTVKAASFLCGLPFESLVCGCMLPGIDSALGYYDNTDDLASQRKFINMFFKSAAIKMNKALSTFGVDEIDDIRDMLTGNRTYLWDIPEFMPVPKKENMFHVGPLSWNDWPDDQAESEPVINDSRPVAVLAFGTCNGNTDLLNRMIGVLLDLGFNIVAAAGGQEEIACILKDDSRITGYLYAPIHRILPHASLVVCHGGQMTIFESLSQGVPVIVLPFQPEQAHNGICLERIGCGRMVVPVCRFVGSSSIYSEMLGGITDEKIKSAITELIDDPETSANLNRFKNILSGYDGLESITRQLEQ